MTVTTMKMLMKSALLIIALTLVKGEEDVISWANASVGCKNKHDSILLPQQYWQSSQKTTTKDILSEMHTSTAAWIDGEVFPVENQYGLAIKVVRATIHVDTELPYIRENGTVEYTPTTKANLPYNQSITDTQIELFERLGRLQEPKDGLYWIPGINLAGAKDRKCIGLTAVNNHTDLVVEEFPCTEMKMAVCIDVSLLKGRYPLQPSFLIEVTKLPVTTHDTETEGNYEKKLQLQITKLPVVAMQKASNDLEAKVIPLREQVQSSTLWSVSLKDLVLVSFIMAGVCLILIIVLAVIMCIMCKRLSILTKDRIALSTPESHTYEGLKNKNHSRLRRLSLRGSKKQKQDRTYTTPGKPKENPENGGYLSMADSIIYKRRMEVKEGHLTPEDNPYSVIPVDMRKERVLIPEASPGLGNTDPKLAIENENFKKINNEYVGMLSYGK